MTQPSIGSTNRFIVLLIIILSFTFSSCTWRYSRELIAPGPPGGTRVMTRSWGLEVLFVAIVEPKSASELIGGLKARENCTALSNIEVDYRSWIFLLANLPRVTVSADCTVAPPPEQTEEPPLSPDLPPLPTEP